MSTEQDKATLARIRVFVASVARVATYGFFPGGDYDPREFTPDEENSAAELEAHRVACAAWERGERPVVLKSGRVEVVTLPEAPDGNGGTIPASPGPAIVCGSSLGMGVYFYEDEEGMRALADLDEMIARLSAEPEAAR